MQFSSFSKSFVEKKGFANRKILLQKNTLLQKSKIYWLEHLFFVPETKPALQSL